MYKGGRLARPFTAYFLGNIEAVCGVQQKRKANSVRRSARRGQGSIVCPDQAEKPSSQVAINRAILIGWLALSALLYACAKSPSANVRGDAAHPTPVHF